MSVLGSSSVEAQETKGVHYKYVTESELSSDEQNKLVYDIPTYVENDDETYYLVYKLNSQINWENCQILEARMRCKP